MRTNSPPSERPLKAYAVIVALSLLLAPPLGVLLLLIKNPWSRGTAVVSSVLASGWCVLLLGVSYLAPAPASIHTTQTELTGSAKELEDFKQFIDRAIVLRNAIDGIQESFAREVRAGQEPSKDEFHREAFNLRDQADTLRRDFYARFGSDIGEYRMRVGGRNDKLFLDVAEAVTRLPMLWYEWFMFSIKGGTSKSIEMHDRYFWEAVGSARSKFKRAERGK